MTSPNYPTVAEVLDPNRRYKPAVLRALRAFAKSKPWAGSIEERQAKFRTLHSALAAAYYLEAPKLIFGDPERDSGSSCFIPSANTIILHGLSVVSFLHEFAHFLFGRSEQKACSWSINVFRRCFPKSFSRCRFDGQMLRRAEEG